MRIRQFVADHSSKPQYCELLQKQGLNLNIEFGPKHTSNLPIPGSRAFPIIIGMNSVSLARQVCDLRFQ